MGIALDEVREKIPVNIDYVGFTFNDIHSSQLNILSVSNGSRYTMNLLPTIEDYSIDIVGGIGSNYFGGTFKKKEFSLNIAFDSVEELQLRAMQELFSEREVHELYFDEAPYKVYNAVISKTPTITYIAFGDVGTRVYKGEGTIVFTCYDPIAYSKNGNYLDDYDNENIAEWSVASGMLDNKYKVVNGVRTLYYDTPISITDGFTIRAYNAGLIEVPFRMYLHWSTGADTLTLVNGSTQKALVLKRTAITDYPILIDTERSLAIELKQINTGTEAEPVYEWSHTREETNVLNQLVSDGRFFTLQPGENTLVVTGATLQPGSELLVPTTDNGMIYYHRYL